MSRLTHFDAQGNAHMVDVGDKPVTSRRAEATGAIVMQPATVETIRRGENKKGDVLAVAQLAGIMGAKRTSDLIPLCHPLPLTKVTVEFAVDADRIHCTAVAQTHGQTGVEMEALTAVQVALLTIYDMCKAIDRGMRMEGIRLLAKSGGRSGDWTADER